MHAFNGMTQKMSADWAYKQVGKPLLVMTLVLTKDASVCFLVALVLGETQGSDPSTQVSL